MTPRILSSLVVLVLFAPPALAQYKCTSKGQTVYSDAPCAPDAKHVGALEDRVTDQQRVDRMRQTNRARSERNAIEAREASEEAERAAIQQERADRAAARAEAERRDRGRRCDQARRDLRYAEQAKARYQDFGMQNSLRQREQEIKGLHETIDRDCEK